MRIWSLLAGDIRFQYRYGFYFLYLIFSILYISLLFAFPAAWREKSAVLMIFSDPAAMGLYFMGAIVLLEKSERIQESIAISPVNPYEYMLAKLFSIGIISVIVGLAIGFFSNAVDISAHFILGIFLCSCFFSAIGLIIAAKSISLNHFIFLTIPVQIIINIPAIAWLFGWKPGWLLFHPGASLMELCENGIYTPIALIILSLWTLATAVIASGTIKGLFKRIGGVKL